ncbi:sporulation protein YtfJ [Desulfosporosinus fructosivorans]|uniref:Sporulation protein YtfJ n=1 Tax=Desulfosporosinus fructosivorans TaxID=2018669 RepID=A0A4Z0R809_9FIRM|nr:GerW family sporulation protein [Desulfosporosinus fructosivorans]TGE37746.1 sporulation protein YtfJ [Desulfosporosinus fructosivorans]
MGNHPIESLMKTAMESIQQIVDVNTIVGDPVETHDGSVIIPISRVSCGFAAGGSEFAPADDNKENVNTGGQAPALPFGGGAGAGVSVQPVGFLVVGNGNIRLLPVDGNVVVDRLIDAIPDVLDRVTGMFQKKKRPSDDIIIARD